MLNESDIQRIGIDWNQTIDVIRNAVQCLSEGDYAQPLKPYLRYRNPKNRIIAMPAFVGGSINTAGIKWIASFPGNIHKGLARASSVVILNNADTGEPLAVICTALLSTIRTASVSGLLIRHFDGIRRLKGIKIGIIGFGPIGQYHLKMCLSLLAGRIEHVCLYDVRPIDPALLPDHEPVTVVSRWEDAFLDADIMITCTVADAPYIDQKPKPGSLHLNVSLRDYKTTTYEWFKDAIIVDDWEEVCREQTDVERMHLEKGLRAEDTRSIVDVIHRNCLAAYPPGKPIMFSPMGMAVFDIALGNYYYRARKSDPQHVT
jgi:ornithine cyclodeaminase